MTAMDRSQGRVSRDETPEISMIPETATGNRGLQLEEPLIFEQGTPGRIGVDLAPVPETKSRLGGVVRKAPVGLPDLAEPQVVRHFVRLSQKNYSIDSGLFPLGSCTMKYNPRLNEKVARMPGFADLHPLQPVSTIQGALGMMHELGTWLTELTGMTEVTLAPAAGAHGELAGLMAIRAAHVARGDARRRVIVPDSAHGTNPASAVLCGYTVQSIPGTDDGRVDVAALKAALGPDVAAVMLTNPNTCGLFERDVKVIADAVHEVGAYFYGDGANFNAIVGRVKPAELGFDCMHINLHKTFSTPHGGGGPGSGPVVFAESLAHVAPGPRIRRQDDGSYTVEAVPGGPAVGRLKAFFGQAGMFTRALAYMKSLGRDGLHAASGDAVLAANYLMVRLSEEMTPAFPGPAMHECLFDDGFLEGTGVSTLDFAKAMIDEGFHPMTMYFPLVVHGAMLIEPTETESKQALDQLVDALLSLARRAKAGEAEAFHAAPRYAPRRRLDETLAARKPVLRWTPPAEARAAAE
ncbi:aminomethyl-transferring glycine dehydrogenase subunit GcvPB [Tistrella mobilis]|uniref:aminomethyl-transferring glycine dehydrogenase subunit GcvPB n=1 Tax=Tistrella mobilis TaxID=171437 RepID=UPI000C09EFE3|nr:glycine dehydrogenase (aminomethyl-transferring) [Tistrella sp.]